MRYPSEEGVIAAWNRRTLQAVGPEPAVAVKPLEWAFRDTKISDDLSVWVARAEGLDFTYSIWGSTNENATAAFTVPKLHNGFFDTLEAAKAAAETDYASRIRSALVATPPAEPVVEADVQDIFRKNCVHYAGNYEITPGGAVTIARKLAAIATKPADKDDEAVVEALLSNITDVVAEAEVDFPAGREAGARVSFDEDAVRGFIRAALAAKDGRS